jgi:hypothetical protein
MMGSAMVTMATELFCLNKLLKSLRYFHVVFLSVVLPVKIFNLTIRDTIVYFFLVGACVRISER